MKKTILLFSGILLSSLATSAQTIWKIDPSHSSVLFEVKHLTISTVTGTFKTFDCTINSKSKNEFENASVVASVAVASISTENLTRDNHLKTDEFFNAEKYPNLSFKSISFEKVNDREYSMTGDLTIRDITKRITVPVEFSGMISLGNKTIAAFKSAFVINRFDYNLKWNDTIDTGGLVVGEEVKVILQLEVVKQ